MLGNCISRMMHRYANKKGVMIGSKVETISNAPQETFVDGRSPGTHCLRQPCHVLLQHRRTVEAKNSVDSPKSDFQVDENSGGCRYLPRPLGLLEALGSVLDGQCCTESLQRANMRKKDGWGRTWANLSTRMLTIV